MHTAKRRHMAEGTSAPGLAAEQIQRAARARTRLTMQKLTSRSVDEAMQQAVFLCSALSASRRVNRNQRLFSACHRATVRSWHRKAPRDAACSLCSRVHAHPDLLPLQLRSCLKKWRTVTHPSQPHHGLRDVEYLARRVVVARALRIAPPHVNPTLAVHGTPPGNTIKVRDALFLRDKALIETRRMRVLLHTLQTEFERLREKHAVCVQERDTALLEARRTRVLLNTLQCEFEKRQPTV